MRDSPETIGAISARGADLIVVNERERVMLPGGFPLIFMFFPGMNVIEVVARMHLTEKGAT